jgi:hypothetical protein
MYDALYETITRSGCHVVFDVDADQFTYCRKENLPGLIYCGPDVVALMDDDDWWSVLVAYSSHACNYLTTSDVNDCEICYQDADDAIIRLPCCHFVHHSCFMGWITFSDHCPTCHTLLP